MDLQELANKLVWEATTPERLGGIFDRWPNHPGYLLNALEERIPF